MPKAHKKRAPLRSTALGRQYMRPASLSGAAMDVDRCDREAVNITCDPDQVGDNCAESVVLTSAPEAMQKSPTSTREETRGTQTPHYRDAGQETVTRGL